MIIHSILFFIASVCSMGYELLLSKVFFELGFDETLSLTIPIGFYLLGMGLGTLFVKNNKLYEQLYKIEFALITLSITIPFIIIGIHVFLQSFFKYANSITFLNIEFFILQFFPLIIGYYSGKELQAFFYIFEEKKFRGFGFALTLSYMGSLTAGLLIPFLISLKLSPFYCFFILALLNIYILSILFFEVKSRKILKMMALPLALVFLATGFNFANSFEKFTITALYSDYKALNTSLSSIKNFIFSTKNSRSVERVRTKYQVIDIIPRDFVKAVTSFSSPFTVYLNSKPQFDSESYNGYHQTMVIGSKNLSRQYDIKNALVLGGGDGILNKEILNRYPNLTELIQIELDPQMVKLASEHPEITNLNGNSYQNPKVKVIYQDALTYLRSTEINFDAIFIDFPLPVTLDLSKLYTKEFYLLTMQRLSPKGYFVFDVPTLNQGINPRDTSILNNYRILFATLESTGCSNFTFFGPLEAFGFCQPNHKKTKFDYNALAEEAMDESVYINLLEMPKPSYEGKDKKSYINSIFRLKRFIIP